MKTIIVLSVAISIMFFVSSGFTLDYNWVKESGVRADTGSVPYILHLPDGRYRLYVCNQYGIVSAISNDGINFTTEPGVRLAPIAGSETVVADPSIVQLDTGPYRMYYKVQKKSGGPGTGIHSIYSAYSIDGINWSRETMCYENLSAPDSGWVSVPDAVKLPDGRIRIFYTSYGECIRSIISNDGLNFTPESGVRLYNAVDPNLIRLPNGTYIMFCATGSVFNKSIGVATSTDAFNFTNQEYIIAPGGIYDIQSCMDPSAIILSDGRIRIYYGGMENTATIRTVSAISSGLQSNLNLVLSWPNPFKPGQGQNAVYFSNLTSQSTIKISNIAGEVVRTIEETDGDGITSWDGENQRGEPVASGVYIYIVTNQRGDKPATGKIIVIR